MLLLFLLFVTAVCPSGQPPPSPFVGIFPLRAVRTTSVLTLWDRLALPFLSLPAWDTHTPYLSCVFYLCCLEWLTAWDLYLGEEGGERVVPWGPKKGRECLEGSWVAIVSLGTAAPPPQSQGPTPSPQRGGPCLQ